MRFLKPEIGKPPPGFSGGGSGRFRRRSDRVVDVDGRGADRVSGRLWTWSWSWGDAGLVAPSFYCKRCEKRQAVWLSLSFLLLLGEQAAVFMWSQQVSFYQRSYFSIKIYFNLDCTFNRKKPPTLSQHIVQQYKQNWKKDKSNFYISPPQHLKVMNDDPRYNNFEH